MCLCLFLYAYLVVLFLFIKRHRGRILLSQRSVGDYFGNGILHGIPDLDSD